MYIVLGQVSGMRRETPCAFILRPGNESNYFEVGHRSGDLVTKTV